MLKDLFIKKPYAENYEIKDEDVKQKNELRIWCSQSPNQFTFQIRTFKPITDRLRGKGKPRKMIAHCTVSIEEMEKILKYMKSRYPSS